MVNSYQYTCEADAFRIRSENQDEVVESVQEHAQEKHDMEMSRKDIIDGMEEREVNV